MQALAFCKYCTELVKDSVEHGKYEYAREIDNLSYAINLLSSKLIFEQSSLVHLEKFECSVKFAIQTSEKKEDDKNRNIKKECIEIKKKIEASEKEQLKFRILFKGTRNKCLIVYNKRLKNFKNVKLEFHNKNKPASCVNCADLFNSYYTFCSAKIALDKASSNLRLSNFKKKIHDIQIGIEDKRRKINILGSSLNKNEFFLIASQYELALISEKISMLARNINHYISSMKGRMSKLNSGLEFYSK